MSKDLLDTMPVGYYTFHENEAFNFQLNRFYSQGAFSKDELIFYEEQLGALTNAKSVTGRLFTKEEHTDHHCQIGNIGLLIQTVSRWIEEKTNGEETGTDGL